MILFACYKALFIKKKNFLKYHFCICLFSGCDVTCDLGAKECDYKRNLSKIWFLDTHDSFMNTPIVSSDVKIALQFHVVFTLAFVCFQISVFG